VYDARMRVGTLMAKGPRFDDRHATNLNSVIGQNVPPYIDVNHPAITPAQKIGPARMQGPKWGGTPSRSNVNLPESALPTNTNPKAVNNQSDYALGRF
jgi:hypothetical protein